MSERDSRYDPIALLTNASESDVLTAAELVELLDFQNVAKALQQEKQKLKELLTLTFSNTELQPDSKKQLQKIVKECNEKIRIFNDQLIELSQSETLKPVIERAYNKVIEEDIILVRQERIAEMERQQQEIIQRYQEKRKVAERNRQKRLEEEQLKNSIQETQPLPEYEPMQPKPKAGKAIITSILTLFVFGLTYILVYLFLSVVIYVLSLIPVVNTLVNLVFYMRGDSPDMMLSLLVPIITYFITMAAQETINKDKPTRGLSCIILGMCITFLHVISIVFNLLYGEGILKNIVQAITGLIIFNSGRKDINYFKTDES